MGCDGVTRQHRGGRALVPKLFPRFQSLESKFLHLNHWLDTDPKPYLRPADRKSVV